MELEREIVGDNRLVPKSFRGYYGDPESELDVAFLFGLVLDYLPFKFAVTSINDSFPDCEGLDPLTGKLVRIEFEVLSYNFKLHDHAEDGCDYIVCWRDNWRGDSKIPIISIEDIIRRNNLYGTRFIFRPKPGSLRERLGQLKESDPEMYGVVNYFITDVLNKIFRKHPGTHLNDRLTRHFGVRAANGKGIFGFYPHGKIVCLKVDEFVKRFGDGIKEDGRVFRETVLGIKILRSKSDADKLGHSLDNFLNALSK